MIVGSFFEGDDDSDVAWRQHDVYPDALGIMIETCNRLTRFARTVLDDKLHESWGYIARCDHRALQLAHDLLAAAWRFRYDMRQAELPLERNRECESPEIHWLRWLRDEIEGWVWHPGLVRSIQLILAHQNRPIGYAAETRLALGILDRFPDVPWRKTLREALEQDLTREMEAISMGGSPKSRASEAGI